ncbi:MAG: HAD-IC family P-type ATPase [Actinomycetaceae bacterium]|nr:HAD-IC family P-type ATPase [Actinomycetaceae bacterium]
MNSSNSMSENLATHPQPPSPGPAELKSSALLPRLIVAACLAFPVMVTSMVPVLQFPGWQWMQLVLTVPVVVYCAWPFHVSAFRSARHLTSTMDTLVSMGIIVSTAWSVWALIWGGAGHIGMRMSMSLIPRAATPGTHAEVYFEVAAMITTFLLAGRYAEDRAKNRAGDALRELLNLGVKEAHVLRANPISGDLEEILIPTSDLVVGDITIIRPGESIPTDGIVIEGSSALDTSLITGESLPVDVGVGDAVTGATINTWGSLKVRATKVGKDTTLAQITALVTAAQASKAPIERLADRVSAVFVPVVLALALAVFLAWLAFGASVQSAITAAVAVLVIACPCALGLATPTALLVGSGRAAKLGIVIKGPEILESTRQIDTILLDKTGTLTKGEMSVAQIISEGGAVVGAEQEPHWLPWVKALEAQSEHPIGKAIAESDVDVADVEVLGFSSDAGSGVRGLLRARVGSQHETFAVAVGKPGWASSLGAAISAPLETAIAQAQAQGSTVVVALRGQAWVTPDSQPQEVLEPSSDAFQAGHSQVASAYQVIDVGIEGMTCASCVNRVNRKLNKLDGVEASVNLATESARLQVGTDVDLDDAQILKAIESAGYTGHIVDRTRVTPVHNSDSERQDSARLTVGNLEDPRVLGVISLSDQLKDSAWAGLEQLRSQGIETMMVTGDNEAAARSVAQGCGIDVVYAGLLPQDKAALVKDLQEQGRTVGFVGDGINDSAALAQAGVKGLGFAMATGSDAAMAASDITLVSTQVTSIPTALRISKATLRVIKQNLFWAFAYNVAAIPLAALGLLNPMIASAAMAMSSVIVVTNSLRLRKAN